MAETLAIKSGGGSESTKVLWQNPSPNSAFASQRVTLSDDISKYKKLRLRFKATNNSIYIGNTDIFVSDFMRFVGNGTPRFAIGFQTSSSGFSRNFTYSDITHITFGGCWSGADGQNNSYAIPLTIWGVN